MPWILDAHEDLAYNMVNFGRDYSLSAAETRAREAGSQIPAFNGDSMLGWPEYQQANVALILGTLFAAPDRPRYQHPIDSQIFHTPQEANKLYWQQLDRYHRLFNEHPQAFRLINTRAELAAHIATWTNHAKAADAPEPVGIVPLMEGADGILSVHELPRWWDAGLRIIGLAWAGNRFCGGTNEPGPLTAEGKALLAAMAEIGFILDLSHMDHEASLESLDIYPGTIIVSHANAARLLKGYTGNRLLSDELIRALFARDVVIGAVPFNNFLKLGWKEGEGRAGVSLRMVADQIDYLCQMAGDAEHVGIGTDFDGGFGVQSAPIELDSIADLPKLFPILAELGYSEEQISGISSGNFYRVLESGLPN